MFHLLISKKGFSLVEILVTVTILGIITAIAVPIFTSALDNQRKQDCANNRQIISAVVKQIMLGMIDNGATQEYIPIAQSKVSSTHEITTYDKDGNITTYEQACVDNLRVQKDDNGADILDENGEKVLIDGFEYNEETGIYSDKRDYKCDICGGDMKWKFNKYDHIPEDHIVYKDNEGNELHAANEQGFDAKRDVLTDWEKDEERKNDTYSKYEEKDDGTGVLVTSLISPDGYLYLDKATVGDIRGGYRKSDFTYDGYTKGCRDGYYLKKKNMAEISIQVYFANQELPICPFNEKDDDGNYKYFYYIAMDGQVYCTCPECSVY